MGMPISVVASRVGSMNIFGVQYMEDESHSVQVGNPANCEQFLPGKYKLFKRKRSALITHNQVVWHYI